MPGAHQSRRSGQNTMPGLTNPGKVGKIQALYRLKSPSVDAKAKLMSPCFFLQVVPFLQKNLHIMVKLINKAIVINVKIHKNKRKRFNLLRQRITPNF
jgi:hypothetical protein